MAETIDIQKQNEGQLNSVQLNVVTFIDLRKAVANGSLEGTMYMIDNSVGGEGHGTDNLQTVCKPGQVINWIIYPMEIEKRPDGNWPPMPKILQIAFLDYTQDYSENVASKKVCTDLKIYGPPDKMRSKYTPSYYYWAGTVLSDIKPGVYPYRLILELEQDGSDDKVRLNMSGRPALKVVEINEALL